MVVILVLSQYLQNKLDESDTDTLQLNCQSYRNVCPRWSFHLNGWWHAESFIFSFLFEKWSTIVVNFIRSIRQSLLQLKCSFGYWLCTDYSRILFISSVAIFGFLFLIIFFSQKWFRFIFVFKVFLVDERRCINENQIKFKKWIHCHEFRVCIHLYSSFVADVCASAMKGKFEYIRRHTKTVSAQKQ